jgi:hypothetical protein
MSIEDDNTRRWYHNPDIVKEKKRWYKILEAEGFYDIEGGVEGHLLRGPTPSRRFYVIKDQLDGHRKKADVDQILSAEDELVNYMSGHKANYYLKAQLFAAQGFRLKELAEACFTWMMHSQGVGERTISNQLGFSRTRIRKHIKVLQNSINSGLTPDED